MLLLIATYHILFNVAEGTPMYVTPNITTDKCPGRPCLELNTYVHNASSYFISNAEFIFLPGVHFLDSQVMIDSKENLQMIGSPNLTQHPISVKVLEYEFDVYDEDDTVTYWESSTHITCTTYNHTGFVFANMTNLTIINITFANCGGYSNVTDQSASILAINILNLLIEGVSVQNGTGYGLMGVNLLGSSQFIKSSFIGNNQFIKNGLNKISADGFRCNGKAYASTTLYYSNGDTNSAGGNMVIVYHDDGNYPEVNQLNLNALVLTLGIDSYFDQNTQCYFQETFQGTGLSLILNQTFYINIRIQDSTFYRNQAWCGGSIYFSHHSVNFDITLENVFVIRAIVGCGGMYIDYAAPQTLAQVHSLYLHNVTFECNYAVSYGSSFAIDINEKIFPTSHDTLQIVMENCNFRSDHSNTAAVTLELISSITLTFSECDVADMLQTKAAFDLLTYTNGLFAIHECNLKDSGIKVQSMELFITNSTLYNSYISAYNTTIILNGSVIFSSSTNKLNGGAISLSSATIVFSPLSYVTFYNNSATYGGAIYMEMESYLNYSSPTNVTFINNTASLSGGAIYVVTPIPSIYYTMACFYQYDGTFRNNITADINVYFEGNFAREAGSAIYGGDINTCRLDYCKSCNIRVFDATHHFGFHENTSSLISSDPRYICPCDTHFCCTTSLNRTAYPGEKITVDFVTIGQRKGISPGVVFTYTDNASVTFTSALRSINRCKSYDVLYTPMTGNLYLSTEVSSNSGQAATYHINISILILPCPAGFVMEHLSSSCVCNPLLHRYVNKCNIHDQTLLKSGSAWIGSNSQGNLSVIDPCPSDYCISTSTIHVLHFDSQCNYNRLGVACGQCPGNLSMTFGSSQCKPCTNDYLLLMIAFAVMGIALIAFLMLFNLTTSSGTINGIILYAFVVRLFKDIFFTSSASNVLDFLSVFIAWLNLDFGIEACFYNGMDSYSKVWLQFSFPLFMITLVVVIVAASRKSSVISKICRYNMVPVISTLVILFYAKVLRIATIIFTYAKIKSADGNGNASSLVWYYDATIPYLGFKHAILFTAGLVVTVFFIFPFTAVMLLTPCLVTKSHWKVLCWMNKLKPFIDCYEAPFKDRYRFWTGATLFHRIVLCIVFSLFSNKQPSTVLLIIITIHAFMIVMVGLAIYKTWLVSLLEAFFHINIIIHSLALFFLYNRNEHIDISTIPTAVCVGSAFICFVCVLLFKLFHNVCKKNHFHLADLKYAALVNRKSAATNTESIVNKDLNNENVEYVYREPLND